MARLLLEHGADLVQRDYDYDDPCYSAIHAAQSAEMVQLLLNHGADPNQKAGIDDRSLTPLHYYTTRDHVAAMRVALDNGMGVDPVGPFWVPLHGAVKKSIEAVLFLLEYDADLDSRDLSRETPLHTAASAWMVDVATLLLECWPEAVWEQEDAGGYTPLHMAASAGKAEMVRFLLERWPEGKKALAKGG
jgi:ankyrin repeat protein